MIAVGCALVAVVLFVAVALMRRRQDTEHVARHVMAESVDAVFTLDERSSLQPRNPRAEALLGAVGQNGLAFVGRARAGSFGVWVEGAHVDLDVRASEVFDGHRSRRVVTVRDVTGEREAARDLDEVRARLLSTERSNDRLRRRLVEQTLRDTLTGLPTRRHLDRRLEQQVDHASETGEPFAVVIVDVDHLKSVNDLHGRAVGDRLLSAVAAFLGEQLYPDEALVRFGGEEFAAVLPGCDGIDAYHRAQGWVTEAALVGIRIGAVRVSRTLSAGVAVFPDAGVTPEEVIAAADSALYRAKQQGRNRVGFTPAGFDGPTSGPRIPRHRAN